MSENPSPETFSALIAQKREEVNRLESLAWAATSARVEAEDELNVLLITSKPDPWPTPEMVDGIRIAVQNCREKKPTSSHHGSGCGPESAPNIARWEARGWVRIPNNAPYLARYSGRAWCFDEADLEHIKGVIEAEGAIVMDAWLSDGVSFNIRFEEKENG